MQGELCMVVEIIDSMEIRYKKLVPEAAKPFRKYNVDAGFDLTAIWIKETDKYIEYGTGLAFEIPDGYVGLLFPRSSVSEKDLMLKNSVGVVDASYRGEIRFRYYNTKSISLLDLRIKHYFKRLFGSAGDIMPELYTIGDRVGQIVFVKLPDVKLVESEELNNTDRGTKGYGEGSGK